MVVTTSSAMITRLQNRLGFGAVSGALQNQLDEAINAGMARAFADGVPGLQ